jgi:DNA helicase-2/ATP-dependent DNA helicase PcrA
MGKARTQRLAELQASDERASGDHRSLFATLVGHLGDEAFKGSGARRFVSLIEELRERMGRLGVADFVDLVLSATGYEAYVRELGNMERLDNLAEFKRMARAFEAEAGEEVGMYDFLDMLALQGEAPSDEGDRVHLMTVHAAKGLEFPCVFLMGMTEGVFPSARTVEERKALGLEEERRLCYVALTRARDLLVMTDSEGFTGARAVKLPSRFLFEMGEENYVREGMLGDDLARQVRTYLANGALLGPRSSAALEGQRIVHPVFGPGTVGPADDSGTSHRVNFDGLPTPRSLNDTFLARLVEEQHASPGSVAVTATVEAVVEPKGELEVKAEAGHLQDGSA